MDGLNVDPLCLNTHSTTQQSKELNDLFWLEARHRQEMMMMKEEEVRLLSDLKKNEIDFAHQILGI